MLCYTYVRMYMFYKVFSEVEEEGQLFCIVLCGFIKHLLLSSGQYHTLEAMHTWQLL